MQNRKKTKKKKNNLAENSFCYILVFFSFFNLFILFVCNCCCFEMILAENLLFYNNFSSRESGDKVKFEVSAFGLAGFGQESHDRGGLKAGSEGAVHLFGGAQEEERGHLVGEHELVHQGLLLEGVNPEDTDRHALVVDGLFDCLQHSQTLLMLLDALLIFWLHNHEGEKTHPDGLVKALLLELFLGLDLDDLRVDCMAGTDEHPESKQASKKWDFLLHFSFSASLGASWPPAEEVFPGAYFDKNVANWSYCKAPVGLYLGLGLKEFLPSGTSIKEISPS